MKSQSESNELANPQQKYSTLKEIISEQLIHQKNGEYMEAENCRLRALSEKQSLQTSVFNDMEARHSKEFNELAIKYTSLIQESNAEWRQTINAHKQNWSNHTNHLQMKDKEQIYDLKIKLNEQLPLKVKQSHELINLRKMQEYTAKQKKFMEAHLVQEKVKSLYNKEHEEWMASRNNTISKAVFNLKNRQAKQMDLYQCRMQKQLEELNFSWHQQKASLIQRYNNEAKEMKARHQRQILSFRGEFTTKGGYFSEKYRDIQLNIL